MSKSGIRWQITHDPLTGTVKTGRFVHSKPMQNVTFTNVEMGHLVIYMRLYCGLIFLPIVQMNVVLNRTVAGVHKM